MFIFGRNEDFMQQKISLVIAFLVVSFLSIGQVNMNQMMNVQPLSKLGSLTDPEEEEEEEEEEDPFHGISVGLNIGSYFASKKTANVYNGTCIFGDLGRPDGVRCYSIAERIDPNTFVRDYQQITQDLNATGVEVPYDSNPLNMRYTPAFYVGMQIKYNWGKYKALVFNFNTVKLKAVDVFTLRLIGTGQQQNAQQDIRTFTISGNEQRFDANLGYRAGVMMNEMTNWYFQFGASMLGTQVEKNQIRIENRSYDLFVGAQNPNQLLTLQNSPTKIGFGGYFSTGVEFFIKDKYTFDISLGFSRDTIKMFDYTEHAWNKWLLASFTI